MSKKPSSDKDKLVASPIVNPSGVFLPCKPDDFGDFVSGLLGKPQTIDKLFHCTFEVTRQDIANVFHLVNQRVTQQNAGILIQFTVKMLYDDDSSVLLNSLTDFERYTEIHPIATVGVDLSWTYLITFKNKAVAEKQEIDLAFRTNHSKFAVEYNEGFAVTKSHRWGGKDSNIYLEINHTDRTWGVDIESLLTGHLKTLFKMPSRAKDFILRHDDAIGLSTGVIVFLIAISGVYIASSRFIKIYLEKVQALATVGIDSNAASILSGKIDFIINVISTGVWPRFFFSAFVFLFISFVVSILLAAWVTSQANTKPYSFVLLSKKAEELRTKVMARIKRDWQLFYLSVFVSIATGIASNMLFAKYFSKIVFP